MKFISSLTLGVAASSLVDVVTAIKYANVKIVTQAPQLHAFDSQTNRLTISHTFPVVPNRMSIEGISTMHVHWKKNSTKPCSDCLLKYTAVSLRGVGSHGRQTTPALDKFTMSIEGSKRKDAVCGDLYPDGERVVVFSKGGTSKNEKYFFSKGEDQNAGVWLGAGEDKLSMSLDVGEIARGTKDVVLDVTFEFVPTDKNRQQRMLAANFKTVKGVFLDIATCGNQDVEVREEKDGSLSGTMKEPWIAPFSGRWLSATGHDLNNGGKLVEVASNGKKVCSSTAIYADGDIDNGIEGYEGCPKLEDIKQGDAITLKAMYESNPDGLTGGFAGYVVVT